MSKKRTLGIGAALALLFSLLLAGSGSTSAQPSQSPYPLPACEIGNPTIKGTPGQPLVGTAGDDIISTNGASRIDAGAGDDVICVYKSDPHAAFGGSGDDVITGLLPRNSTWDGGPGADRLWVIEGEKVSADLGTKVWEATGGRRLAYTGFEDIDLSGNTLDVRGTPRADRIVVAACNATVRGLAGADRIRVELFFTERGPVCYGQRAILYGGNGNDVLIGTRGRDQLYGGPGFDRANGRKSRDLCRSAERKLSCER